MDEVDVALALPAATVLVTGSVVQPPGVQDGPWFQVRLTEQSPPIG